MSKQIENHSIKAGELKRDLASVPDDTAIVFAVDGVPLHFMRFKTRGDKLEQMEFNECPEPEYRLNTHVSARGSGPDR